VALRVRNHGSFLFGCVDRSGPGSGNQRQGLSILCRVCAEISSQGDYRV